MTQMGAETRREAIIRFAEEIAEEYRSDDNLIACCVTGSFTTGTYKKYSDVDLHFVFKNVYKNEYAVYGRLYKDIRFDLIFDDVQTTDDLLRRHFGNSIRSAIEIWDKVGFVRDRKQKYDKKIELEFIQILHQKRSLRHKCLNYLTTVASCLFEKDYEKAIYILRECVDEIIRIQRVVVLDPNWDQYKSNIDWLRRKENWKIYDIFRKIHKQCSAEEIVLIVQHIAAYINGLSKLEMWRKFPVF